MPPSRLRLDCRIMAMDLTMEAAVVDLGLPILGNVLLLFSKTLTWGIWGTCKFGATPKGPTTPV